MPGQPEMIAIDATALLYAARISPWSAQRLWALSGGRSGAKRREVVRSCDELGRRVKALQIRSIFSSIAG